MTDPKGLLRARLGTAGELGALALRSRSMSTARTVWAIAADATTIPGWVEGAAAREVAARSMFLDGEPTIVEVGVFMGRSTVLLAAARRARRPGGVSGKVYCVDPFDGSGDAFSVPVYKAELDKVGAASLEEAFRRSIAARGLDPWIEVLEGPSAAIAATWRRPIDLLLLDGDHSPRGARDIFASWSPLVRPGGQIILHNTGQRIYAEGHDGNHRIATTDLTRPPFEDARQIAYTTFATKARNV